MSDFSFELGVCMNRVSGVFDHNPGKVLTVSDVYRGCKEMGEVNTELIDQGIQEVISLGLIQEYQLGFARPKDIPHLKNRNVNPDKIISRALFDAQSPAEQMRLATTGWTIE
jgi:hypothetical protein